MTSARSTTSRRRTTSGRSSASSTSASAPPGSRVFAALKGAVDGGLDIHNDKRYAGYDLQDKSLDTETLERHIKGGVVAGGGDAGGGAREVRAPSPSTTPVRPHRARMGRRL